MDGDVGAKRRVARNPILWSYEHQLGPLLRHVLHLATEAVAPVSLHRAGLRFVNVLHRPEDTRDDWSRWVRPTLLAPSLDAELTDGLVSHSQQLVFESAQGVRSTVRTGEAEENGEEAFLLDIDTYSEPNALWSEGDVWESFDALNEHGVALFQALVTAQMVAHLRDVEVAASTEVTKMTELLQRDEDVTTVSGHDRWASVLNVFADATPLTRPTTSTRTFDLLRWMFRQRNAYTQEWASRPAHMKDAIYVLIDGNLVALTLGRTVAYATDQASLPAPASDHDTVSADLPEVSDDHPGTAALRDLERWLGMGLDAIVRLASLSPSTRAFWRENPTAPIRPNKAGRLLRLHAAVGLLVGEVGLEHANRALRGEGWLAEPFDEDRLVRLEVRVRQALLPEGLQPPAYLDHGGLTRKELRARALADPEDEKAQLAVERASTTPVRPPCPRGDVEQARAHQPPRRSRGIRARQPCGASRRTSGSFARKWLTPP